MISERSLAAQITNSTSLVRSFHRTGSRATTLACAARSNPSFRIPWQIRADRWDPDFV